MNNDNFAALPYENTNFNVPNPEIGVAIILKPKETAALPPCSPAKGSSRRVLGGYVSPLLRLATLIRKKIKTLWRGPQALSVRTRCWDRPLSAEEIRVLYIADLAC